MTDRGITGWCAVSRSQSVVRRWRSAGDTAGVGSTPQVLDLVVGWRAVPGCPFDLIAPVLNIKYSRVLALKNHKIKIQLISHCQTCNKMSEISPKSVASLLQKKELCVYFFLCVCVRALNVSHAFIQRMCLCVFQNAISRQCKAGKGWILTVTEDTPPTPVTPVRQRLHPLHIHTPSTPPLLHPPCPQGRRSPPSPPHSLKVPPDEVMNCDHVYLGCASSSVNGSSDCGEIPAWIICIQKKSLCGLCMDRWSVHGSSIYGWREDKLAPTCALLGCDTILHYILC